jgi:hypothetical protein
MTKGIGILVGSSLAITWNVNTFDAKTPTEVTVDGINAQGLSDFGLPQ